MLFAKEEEGWGEGDKSFLKSKFIHAFIFQIFEEFLKNYYLKSVVEWFHSSKLDTHLGVIHIPGRKGLSSSSGVPYIQYSRGVWCT